MIRSPNKGFIIILVTVSLAVLILSASVIVSIGCSELMATRVRNDLLISAYYTAISGCERMYAHLKTLTNPSWNTPMNGSLQMGSTTIGTYSATAYDAGSNEFYIVSTGTVNGHTATATVKLGYLTDYSGPLVVGAYGTVTLNGSSNQAKIKMEGPVASSTTDPSVQGRVEIAGNPQTIANTGTPKVSFWLGSKFDTDNDGTYVVDSNFDGTVTRAEAIAQGKEAIFNADNAYDIADDEISDKDAFYYYYVTYLNDPANNKLGQALNIGSGQSRYYSGDQTFGTNSIPDSVPIIFVNGNCTISDNDGATSDHTVVVTGNLTLHQPSNGPGDRNSYIVFGNVTTDGEMGHGGGTKGDLVIFANGNIDKEGGGKMSASFFANGTLTMNTGGDTGKKHLMLSKLTEDWSSLTDGPVGIPPNYPINVIAGFSVKNQTSYSPVWQRK